MARQTVQMTKHRRNEGEPPTGDYPVGYKRPPKNTQFVAGKSGNPSGRPQKMKSEKEVLEALLRKEFVVGGAVMTARELAAQRLLKGALDGATGLTKEFYSRIDATGAGRDDAQPGFTTVDNEILADLHERMRPDTKAKETIDLEEDDQDG
jgi:hypothetical protein